jgi:LacI family transcriptional regulator
MDDDPQRETVAVTEFMRRRVDGLVLTTAAEDMRYLAPTLERGLPVVFVDRAPAGIRADVVASENRAAAAAATRHLLERGHRRIALLVDRLAIHTANERRKGFLEELGRWGVPTAEVHIAAELHGAEDAERVLLGMLASPHPPTAVFSAQNLITIGALHALRKAGKEQSVALIGFDDLPLADLLVPAVTVIIQDAQEIGRTAAERIFRRLDGEDLPIEHLVIPTRLVERGSGEILPPA